MVMILRKAFQVLYNVDKRQYEQTNSGWTQKGHGYFLYMYEYKGMKYNMKKYYDKTWQRKINVSTYNETCHKLSKIKQHSKNL